MNPTKKIRGRYHQDPLEEEPGWRSRVPCASTMRQVTIASRDESLRQTEGARPRRIRLSLTAEGHSHLQLDSEHSYAGHFANCCAQLPAGLAKHLDQQVRCAVDYLWRIGKSGNGVYICRNSCTLDDKGMVRKQ